MNVKNRLKAKISPSLKRRLNSIRYSALPTLKKRIIRLIRPPKFPRNPDGKVLIHLGCGDQDDKRFINVDMIPFRHVHFVHYVSRLPMFPDNYADLIYGSHLLEHISYKYTVETLKEWRRVLKNGGVLRLAVPDFDLILKIYGAENNSIEKIEGPLMGGQNYKYNFHMAIFNKAYLTSKLSEAGFKEVRIWDPKTAPYYPFTDWASREVYDKYPLSLNLEAVK